jgi:hypothetical protein
VLQVAVNKRIGLRDIESLAKVSIIWDRDVPGFGARRQTTNAVSYVLIYRTAEKPSALSYDREARCPLDTRDSAEGGAAHSGERGVRRRSGGG